MEDDRAHFEEKAKQAANRIMKKRFSREMVYRFVEQILGDKERAEITDEYVSDDDSYVMTLLSVANSRYQDRTYDIEISDDTLSVNGYTIPQITYIRRKK